jgi:riboflavin kinase/FMN adenylyltransferase
MEIIHYPDDPAPLEWRQSVLALGKFDGLHRGHRKIVDRVRYRATEVGVKSVILTFDPPPPRIVRPDEAPPLLMTQKQKLECLAESGIDGVAVVRFTPEMSRWDPVEFVETVLVEWLRVSEVLVGANFLFGRNRSGNFTLLRQLGVRQGFRVEKIDPVCYKEFVVSSTRIRRLIAGGQVDEAAVLLGRHYAIDGEVVLGAQRGQQQGVPTANLRTANEVLPPDGVYATTVVVEGLIHASVTNVGVRPTFEIAGERVVETHLFDYDGDLYGMHVRLGFVQWLRPELAFADAAALRRQIDADCADARALFRLISL